MSKLHDFAQAVGADIKEIKTSIASKTVGVSEERLTQAMTQVKTDIISKMTELGTRLDTIEQEDLVDVYNAAKA